MMPLTTDMFARLFPQAVTSRAWVAAINTFTPRYDIDTLPRLTAWLAQCGHESQGFTRLVENLNYSATALMATWPKRFPPDVATEYHHQPGRIANRAYANRMGNGPEESGDGWRHRGKGCIQLTGKDNQSAFAKHAGLTLETVGGYLLTIEGAIHAACWFWQEHNCNRFADSGDMQGLTRAINGGLNGLDDREARLKKVTEVMTA